MKSAVVFLFLLLPLFAREANNTLNFPSNLSSNYQFKDLLNGVTFSSPVCLRSPQGSDDLFVVEKNGKIYLIKDIGNPQKQLFMDISSRVDAGGESGLLSIAFHPDYASNKTLYVFYTTNHNNARYQRISRFVVQSESSNLNTPYSFNETWLIQQYDQASNHNGGDMHFGPDGYLYISLGDEGSQNDAYSNSQRIDKDYFSGVLRIDIDKKSGNLNPNSHASIVLNGSGNAEYKVPADNPWIGATSFNGSTVNPNNVRTEFWAVGLRNPWRMSFDPSGNLWIGDVGQGIREEVDFVAAGENGKNFGWNFREGFISGPKSAPAGVIADDPVYDYVHSNDVNYDGRSVTGGVFYSGDQIPSLKNKYIFADHVSGNTWSLTKNGSQVSVNYFANEKNISAFGLHPATGEVLICKYDTGKILKLVEATGNENEIPVSLSATGAFEDVANLIPEAGIEHYEPNITFWSDYAIKTRWFSLPQLSQKFGFKSEGPWNYPAGAVWIKHFELEMERGNPNSKVRVETRFLVKTDNGAYGLSYRWNSAGTEAALAPAEGESINYNIRINGVSTPKTWTIPSRSSCLECHTSAAGFALSFNTRQLNRTYGVFGSNQNILTGLYNNGYLDVNPGSPASHPKHYAANDSSASIQDKARSYMDVNCSYCHQQGGPTPAEFDARALLSNFQTGLINGIPLNNGGDSSRRLILPGDPGKSVVLNRLSASNGFSRMPPIATTELDHGGISLIQEWIQSLTQSPVPAPWNAADVNGSNFSVTESGGTFTMNAAGHDIWNANDSFGFLHQPKNGDVTVIARVDSLENVNAWSKSGVMIRETTGFNSKYVTMVVTPTNGIAMQYRSSTGANSAESGLIRGLTAPVWLKLERSGSHFTGSYSSNGQNWIELGQIDVSMNETVQAGLALTSHNSGTQATSSISQVQVYSPVEPLQLTETDVNNSGFTSSFSNGVYTMTAAGHDIWNANDSFGFLNQQNTGDVTLVTRVDSLQNINQWTKGGLMVRESTSNNSKYVTMVVTPSNGIAMQYRSNTGANSAQSGLVRGITAPVWLKLTRYGNEFTGSYSNDGLSWTELSRISVNMNSTAVSGLALTSHNSSTAATAAFSQVQLLSQDSGEFSFENNYQLNDIGNASFTSKENNGEFTLRAAGNDIWGSSDEFGFANVEWEGDITLICKVKSLTDVHAWTKTGVMIRESLSANSKNAFTCVTGSRASFHWRQGNGSITRSINYQDSETHSPMWLKLTRVGNVFSSFYSIDGGIWEPLGEQTLNMPNKVYVGLALTSHIRGTIATTVIDNVEIKNPDDELVVTRLSITNADTKSEITNLYNGLTIDRSVYGNNFNIRALLNGVPGSVAFRRNGSLVKYEHFDPYFMEGDDGSWAPGPGTYTFEVTPSSQSDGGGISGETIKVKINIQ